MTRTKDMKNILKNKAGLYAAFKAKDARFDGRIFIGIASTGIYCRPVCRAKQPKIENCTFYSTAAAAEQAGYRPCLICRPELAPGTSTTDATATLAHRAARMLEENCDSGFNLDVFAKRLGYTGRHLRRAFTAEYTVPPVQYLQTCRLLLAKNLLTSTSLSVIDVAMAAGFDSLRRFNALFKKHYALSPTSLRKRVLEHKKQDRRITLSLGYRPPYPFSQMLRFLDGRAIAGVEVVENDAYLRTADMITPKGKRVRGVVRIENNPQKNTLVVTLSEALLPVLPQVLARVKHLFDLNLDPLAVYETLCVMNEIRPNLCVLGTRLPGCFNAFEMAVRAVLGQQITVRAASTLAGRLVQTYGAPIQTGIAGLTHVFPSPEDILALNGPIETHLGPLGIIATRARTIYALALAFVDGKIDFGICADPEEEIKKLMDIPGIGKWTAQYIAMRAMGFTDAFLETDAGVKKALLGYTTNEMLTMAEAFRPWRSYATVNLWNSL